jgi:hypothetical protein
MCLAFHSFVMADALLIGNSHFSVAASWLSQGWLWAFKRRESLYPPQTTIFSLKNQGNTVTPVGTHHQVWRGPVYPPRWPRPAPSVP